MIRYPSVKTLLELTGDRKLALQVRKLIDGRTPCHNSVLNEVDELLGGHGVEYLRYGCANEEEPGYEDEGFSYVNMGDTYNVTLVVEDYCFYVTTWGDRVERHEKRCSACKRIARRNRREEERQTKTELEMRKNIAKVIDAFVKAGGDGDYHTKLAVTRFKGDSKGTCATDGDSIFSYAEVVARRNEDGTVWIRPYGGTATTRSHISACQAELGHLTRCQDETHADCMAAPEMARDCAQFTRKQLRLKQEGKVA